MRNTLISLALTAVAILVVLALLPVVGFLLLFVVAVVVLAIVAFFAAPLLARLPWFRDRIHVDEESGHRSVRFGRGFYTSSYNTPYRNAGETDPFEPPAGHLDDGDVIDVEGREIPDKEQKD
jgi:hypothetical protein